eukprot:tig00022080_g23788.t1
MACFVVAGPALSSERAALPQRLALASSVSFRLRDVHWSTSGLSRSCQGQRRVWLPQISCGIEADGPEPSPGPSPSDAGKPITAMLELAFRKTWFYLYSAGVGDGYTDSMKEFLRAVVVAYLRGYTIEALKLELMSNEIITGNAQLDEFIRLNEEEKEIRAIWITLVFLTLNAVRYRPRDNENWTRPVVVDPRGLEQLVLGVIESRRKGYKLDALKLEQTLLLDEGETGLSTVEASIRSQWMRIVYLTLELVDDTAS